MKRILLAALLTLWSTMASAGVTCTVPFNLLNGTTADASQVMANYNAILTCLTRAASAGANNDITSIIGLTTPLSPAQGGSFNFVGGTSTGTGNAQVVATTTPANFSLTAGNLVYFVAGFTNSGPTQINVAGTGLVNVLAHTPTGLIALSGGEIVATQVTLAFYDGTQFQLLDAAPASGFVQPCTEIAYHGVTTPSGYVAENGQTVLRASFPNLFACLAVSGIAATTISSNTSVTVPNSALFQVGWYAGGSNVTCNSTISSIPDGTHIVINNAAGAGGATTLTIGPYPQGDCSATFNVPNANGRATVGIDTTGSHLSSTACPNPASVGSTCGSLTQTILATNLPPYTPAGTVAVGSLGGSTPNVVLTPGSTVGVGGTATGGQLETLASALSTAGSFVFTGTAAPGQNTTPFLLQPVVLALKAIKF